MNTLERLRNAGHGINVMVLATDKMKGAFANRVTIFLDAFNKDLPSQSFPCHTATIAMEPRTLFDIDEPGESGLALTWEEAEYLRDRLTTLLNERASATEKMEIEKQKRKEIPFGAPGSDREKTIVVVPSEGNGEDS